MLAAMTRRTSAVGRYHQLAPLLCFSGLVDGFYLSTPTGRRLLILTSTAADSSKEVPVATLDKEEELFDWNKQVGPRGSVERHMHVPRSDGACSFCKGVLIRHILQDEDTVSQISRHSRCVHEICLPLDSRRSVKSWTKSIVRSSFYCSCCAVLLLKPPRRNSFQNGARYLRMEYDFFVLLLSLLPSFTSVL